MIVLRRVIDLMVHSPMGRELFADSEEEYMMFRDTMRYLEHIIGRVGVSEDEE